MLTRDSQKPGPTSKNTPLGRVAQLARARRLQRRGHRFKPCHAHHPTQQATACAAVAEMTLPAASSPPSPSLVRQGLPLACLGQRMQRIQTVPERLIGLRIEVAVAVQCEADRGTKRYGSSWIFESCLTCANALRRVQHPGFSLISPQQLPEVNALELEEPTPGTGPSLVVGGLDLGTGRS